MKVYWFFIPVIVFFHFRSEGQVPVSLPADTIGIRDTISSKRQLEEVTVTAFRSSLPLRSVAGPVNLIPSSKLQQGISLTPVEALNLVPGILVHHGTLTTNRLTIRGIGSRSPYSTNKIKAYFGEIPLTGGDGETTFEDLDNEGIRKIEIIKGPSSAIFGAGLGGTILIYPEKTDNNFIRHQVTAGSFSTLKNMTSFGISGRKLNIYSLLSSLQSDGFRDNNETRRESFTLATDSKFSKLVQGSLLIRITHLKAFIPSSVDSQMMAESPWKAAPNWAGIKGYEDYISGQGGFSVSADPGESIHLSLTGFGSFRDADELRPFNLLKERNRLAGSRGYIRKTWSTNSYRIELTGGYEILREKYKWETISNSKPGENLSDNHEKRGYENFFLQQNSTFRKKLVITAGLNLNLTHYNYSDHFLTDGDQSGRYNYKSILSPLAGVNYQVAGNLNLFGNISHGFSPPTLAETLLPEGKINPEIKPERGWNTEAGLRGSVKRRFIYSASIYRITVRDLLVARRTGDDSFTGVNAGRSVHPGFEAEWQTNFTRPGAYPAISFGGNLSLMKYHFSDFVDNGTDYSGNLLPGTAKSIRTFSLKFQPVRTLSLDLMHHYNGRMAVNDANNSFTNDYSLTSLNLDYNQRWKKLSVFFRAGINNLLDRKYASMIAVNALSAGGRPPRYYYPGNPRNFYLNLKIGWNK